MAPAKTAKAKKVTHKFTLDCSQAVADKIFDTAAFEKYLHDRIKVNGRTGALGEKVKITREGDSKVTVTAHIAFSKRYLKYLAKRFLKKNQLRDWLRVVATNRNTFELKYFNIDSQEQSDDEDDNNDDDDE
ncbi:60S ribosomal protein L22 [Sorochytrium milnesiophthora]